MNEKIYLDFFSFLSVMSFSVKTSSTAAPPRNSQYVGPYLLQKTLGKGQTGRLIAISHPSTPFIFA